jgi:Cu-Zn family superoxide dismutase
MRHQGMTALMFAASALLATPTAMAADWQASADLHNPDGNLVGEVLIRDTEHGALLHARLLDLPAGAHAFHIHEKGKCEAPFKSAGGHYNPDGNAHGLDDPDGRHAGDMPNVHVPSTGKTEVEILNEAVNVGELLDADNGTAIVMHEGPDDYSSDPAGAAGSRIACGVINER